MNSKFDVKPMASASRPQMSALPSSDGFLALIRAFFGSGGIARADELARMLQERNCGDYIGLARLLAAEQVFGFEWRDTLWVPMFQFDPYNFSVKSSFEKVWRERAPTLKGWQFANWLATPNASLANRRPLDVLDLDCQAVLSVAKLDPALLH